MSEPAALIRTLVQPLAIALLLAVVVRGVFQIYSIPSDSMAPELTPGDQILVTRYFGGEPRRGDVVVFHSPHDSEELLVKRVVGLPGDRVDSLPGILEIAGATVAEPWDASGAMPATVVPSGHYFVLGDNRETSFDSRHWGPVPRETIVGRARMVLWCSASGATENVHAAATNGGESLPQLRDRRLFKWLR